MERFDFPGTESIRSQVGIVQEDPRVFRPYTMTECCAAAEILAGDSETPKPVRKLLAVGLCLDLRPGHLTPQRSRLAHQLRRDRKTVVAHELAWESVDPVLRAEIVGKAARMILLWRARQTY